MLAAIAEYGICAYVEHGRARNKNIRKPEKVFSIRNLIIVVAVTRKSRGDSEWLCALLLLLLFLKDAKV